LNRRVWILNLICLALVLTASSRPMLAQSQGLLAWWKFDEGSGRSTTDSVTGKHDEILNNFEWVRGVSGKALRFDGFTAAVFRSPQGVPQLRGNFTIEGWVALQSYPWNWIAIIDQENHHSAGYYFGIDSEGRLGLQLRVWGNWEECASSVRVPLMKWVHVAATYDPEKGIRLYVDARLAGTLPVTGEMKPTKNTGLMIGRNLTEIPPTSLVRAYASYPASYSLDGIIDDLRIYDRTLTLAEIQETSAYGVSHGSHPPLSPRHWPVIPSGPNHFGAVYCRLSLYPQWDALWRSGPNSDVVVRFNGLPFHYAFWRGTNFEENLVTANGIWVGDQSFESGTKHGTAEHMNDKQCRHQSISILQSTGGRVVLHWRYGLVDVLGDFSHVDPLTGWGDWADEYFYIYPDGISVRYGTVHGTARHYSFTEPTLLLSPGLKAEDLVSLDAVAVANMAGQARTYSWADGFPRFPFPVPTGANVARVNLKSDYKPFYIYVPGTILGPYGAPEEERPLYSHFPTWDHWPVNQIPSDGRLELFPDHYASAAIMSPDPFPTAVSGPGPSKSMMFLFGLTKRPMNDLVELARSWLRPPKLELKSLGFASGGYAMDQRAYVLMRTSATSDSDVIFKLEASEDSPIFNPALVIKDWGERGVRLKINGHSVPPGPNFTWGHEERLEGSDLVVWFRQQSTHLESITLSPTNR
jgi:Concanavalin A-like lectin/glucanases superfamily